MKRVFLLLLSLLGSPAVAETPEEIRQRLENYRQWERDTEIYLERKKAREHAETWQRYGTTEIKKKGWRRQGDGSWVTEANFDVPDDTASNAPETARIRFGDNLAKIAQRYNLTIHELLKLNPGLRSARMVVGSTIRVSNLSGARSRLALGLRWPNQETGDETSAHDQIAVSCKALTINTYRYGRWARWVRPERETPFEQLVIDRCSTKQP